MSSVVYRVAPANFVNRSDTFGIVYFDGSVDGYFIVITDSDCAGRLRDGHNRRGPLRILHRADDSGLLHPVQLVLLARKARGTGRGLQYIDLTLTESST